ncbi:MAG: LysR family transcriptional regulator [Myxococcales bacterium]|nr:LysR family transcriptional regulator [Myxococcales bacterium]MCB9748811.1 LysR family transcriptional regulator [Myxococcales bacterium]
MDSLLCFEAAARLLNFRAAAKSVALTPAALSQRIKQLEQQLEAKLFERSTRSVQLTEAGRALLPVARSCIAAGRECAEAVRGARGPAPIELTIGTRFELGMSWLVASLHELERRLPHITIHLFFGSGPELLERLHARRLDCTVTSARLTDAALDSLTLHQERYVFVGAPELLEREPFDAPEDAERHTLLDIDPSMPLARYLTTVTREEQTLRFGRFRWLGLGAAIRQQALAGHGVAVLPRYMIAPDLEAGRLAALLPTIQPLPDFFRLVFRADDPGRRAYEDIAEVLRGIPIC